jgi:hypothetical protein
MLNIQLGIKNFEIYKKNKTPETRAFLQTYWSFICRAKNKTPVISRSFNHQSKNEQF